MDETQDRRRHLTERQRRVLDAIRRHVRPVCTATLRALCKELGFVSTNGLACHLDALEKKGHIRRGPHGSHLSIELTELTGAIGE